MLKEREILNLYVKKQFSARELLLKVRIWQLLFVASAEAMKKLGKLRHRLFGRTLDFGLNLLNGLYGLHRLYRLNGLNRLHCLHRLYGLNRLLHRLSLTRLRVIGFVY